MTSSIATILFTDVVGSTALMQRFGDERTGGRLEDWGASCHDDHVLIAVCFLVDDEAALGASLGRPQAGATCPPRRIRRPECEPT